MGFYNKDLRFNELKNYRAGERNIGQALGKGLMDIGNIKQDAKEYEFEKAKKPVFLLFWS